jgi:hypothetical protein
VKRFNASAWLVLSLVVAAEIVGCEGESTTGDDDEGKGGSGGGIDGGTGGSNGGTTSGSSGTGGDRGGAAPTGGRGGTPSGGSGGQAGEGATGGEAGDPGEGGVGGSAGEGGAGPEETTVSGRVVDFWMRPLNSVPVTIGTQTVATNADGRFSIAAVAPTYDVDLVVSWPGGQAGRYAWRFEGLTRRDPTLQVYKGRETRNANITLDPQNETLNESRTLFVVSGGPDGSHAFEDVNGAGLSTSTSWAGPPTMTATLHALLWELDANELPTAYRSHDTVAATFDAAATMPTTVTLNLPDETITSNPISGSVMSASSADRVNYAFVRFAGGASIRVVAHEPGPDTWSYLLPVLPVSSTITVAASTGNSFFGAFAIAHRYGLAPGQTGVAIAIPTPLTQVVPVPGMTGVDASTQFSWTGTPGPCVFHAEDVNYYEGIFVVTTRRTITFPTFGGFTPRSAEPYDWRVERHGTASSVDALAGMSGYLDPFSRSGVQAEGPRVGDGSYSVSTGRRFTTAP